MTFLPSPTSGEWETTPTYVVTVWASRPLAPGGRRSAAPSAARCPATAMLTPSPTISKRLPDTPWAGRGNERDDDPASRQGEFLRYSLPPDPQPPVRT